MQYFVTIVSALLIRAVGGATSYVQGATSSAQTAHSTSGFTPIGREGFLSTPKSSNPGVGIITPAGNPVQQRRHNAYIHLRCVDNGAHNAAL